MNKPDLQTIALGEGLFVVLEPELLLWVIADISHLKQARRVLGDAYGELRKKLVCDMERMATSHLIDMVELYPTTACNMYCTYCYIPDVYRKKALVMSRDEVNQVVCKLFEWVEAKGGMKRIIFHGGEPLMARDSFFPVIDQYWRDAEFGIQTNATLMTPEDARFIKERNVHVSLSLDGHTAQLNDELRRYHNGAGTYDDVVRSISLFKDYEWNGVIVTITRHNVHYLAQIARFLHSMGVRSALFNPVSPTSPGGAALMPTTEDLQAGYRNLLNELIRLNSGPEARRFVVDNIESLVVALITSNMRVLYCHMTPCGAGRFMYVIDSAGDVYPCSEFAGHEEFRCGNVFSNPLTEVFNAPICQQLRARHVSTIPGCRACGYRMICGANCPAAVQSISGHMTAKSPYCEFLKASVNLIFRTFFERGIEIAFSLVSVKFEEMLRKSTPLLEINQSWGG